MAHRRHSPARRKKTRKSWFAMGALLGALPPCAWARSLLHLSLVRDDRQRTLLFDMDSAIQQLAADAPDHPSTVQLTGIYHNLLRQWAEL